MIERQQVIDLTNEWLADKEYFLVDVVISKDDKITVEIDHAEGVWIEDCAELSRYIESKLNGAADDYELEVGSAGLGQPFKVIQQYKNHLGLDVEVLTKEGKKLKGILKDANDYDFALTITKKEKVEGAKRPQIVEEELRFTYDSVKYTKYIINFK
ncbi:MAG: ribosome assembly cofactor RimP [Bacteroidaceae bacterium]|nr:ribosome assembly cofactor RimP [Bacteroidaceae bacterium]